MPQDAKNNRRQRARTRRRRSEVPFNKSLVLNRWILSLFGVASWEKLSSILSDDLLEGIDEDNVHKYYRELILHLPADARPALSDVELLEYDQNIVKHTIKVNKSRVRKGEEPIRWKYFQYLALLFTEIYLDRFFRDPASLRDELNAFIRDFNEDRDDNQKVSLFYEGGEARDVLNKVSFWMATGSGKTLLMHINIHQYKHYYEKHMRARRLDHIILITPNEGLSRQHQRNFEISGIQSEVFSKESLRVFAGSSVEIIHIGKIKDEMGPTTVAVEAFEGNNLVLVDEGHRGASSGEKGQWMRFRNILCENGFSFEYSATFGQAVKGDRDLTQMYAKNIIFDYSYKYFYGDGFGKDYQILNLDDDTEREHLNLYLTACLLVFYQQVKFYLTQKSPLKPFQLEKPLLVFVGGSVTKTLNERDASDVVSILLFLEEFISNRRDSIAHIEKVLNEGIVTEYGQNIFANRFPVLNISRQSSEEIFVDVLREVFNAGGGGRLYVENLKGAKGEVALRVGADNKPFGVINVGDDAKLVKKCEERGIDTGDLEFKDSLFHTINSEDSTVNLLIGSRKFSEGWDSWRVSTMGLMNIGRSEGAQIIQLFGRGVRLKGYNKCLKRTPKALIPRDVTPPNNISLLETLSIFGIKADYMAQFRDFLEEEGLPANDERIEIILPVIRNLGKTRLKKIALREKINGISTKFGDAFRKLGPVPTLSLPSLYLKRNKVHLNWYPKVEALRSAGVLGGEEEAEPNIEYFTERHTALLDIDKIYFELENFKADRGWYNFNLSKSVLVDLLLDNNWYVLYIPEELWRFDSYGKVFLWQEVAATLLKKYVEKYYKFSKHEWELPHLEYQYLSDEEYYPRTDDDGGYKLLIEASEAEIVSKINELREAIGRGEFKHLEFRGLKTIWYDRHLYYPLLHSENGAVQITPVALNKGEKRFVEDLREYCEAKEERLKGVELYLLRNLSRGKGVGFFEAGNFYPDFIMWLVDGSKQKIAFIEPKGLRNLSPEDPKILFYKTIKEIEERLGDSSVTLYSFIVSNTPPNELSDLWRISKEEMEQRNIIFQQQRFEYIGKLFDAVI